MAPIKRTRRSSIGLDRWMIIGTGCLMILTLGILARVIRTGDQWAREFADNRLDRALAAQNMGLRASTNTYSRKLDEEVQQVMRIWPAEDSVLLLRWLPILEVQPAIHSIFLADDRGNEWALVNDKGILHFTITRQDKAGPSSSTRRWKHNSHTIPPPEEAKPNPDPRTTPWFGKALENQKGRPSWTEGEPEDDPLTLYLSGAIRPRSIPGELLVICFKMDAGIMLAQGTVGHANMPGVVFNSKLEPLTRLDPGPHVQLWDDAVRAYRARQSVAPFAFDSEDEKWLGQIVPVHLNGATFHSGLIVDLGEIEQWSGKRNTGLWYILALLVLLSLLLTLIFIQGRSADRQVQRQQRRSSQQARHLARAIEEREVLDREVHHRVKNNLQVVSSLLNLQAQRIADEGARKEFMRGKRRIDSMALVHHKLYRQTDLSAVDLGLFIDDLAKAMAAMFEPDSRSVGHSVDTDGILSDADTSIQLGMILCELLANSFQHAFPSPIGGHIQIKVRKQDDGSYKLTVKDNGRGFAADAVGSEHLGLEVVEALAQQLDGAYTVTNDGGTMVEVTFRMGERL